MTFDRGKEEEKTPQLQSTFQNVWWYHSRVSLDIVEEKSHTQVSEGDRWHAEEEDTQPHAGTQRMWGPPQREAVHNLLKGRWSIGRISFLCRDRHWVLASDAPWRSMKGTTLRMLHLLGLLAYPVDMSIMQSLPGLIKPPGCCPLLSHRRINSIFRRDRGNKEPQVLGQETKGWGALVLHCLFLLLVGIQEQRERSGR